MPGKSMRGDQSKKMSKEKPIQNTELVFKRNQYIALYNREARQRKKKKKKEKEKWKTASGPAPSGVCFGNLRLATTLIRVRHTVSVWTRIAGEIKPVTQSNRIWTNLEELDLDNGAQNLPAAKTTASFCQSSSSQPQEQIRGPSQLDRQILSGNWGRASTTRLQGGCSLIS